MSYRTLIATPTRLGRILKTSLLWAACVALAIPGNLCCGVPGWAAACCQGPSESSDGHSSKLLGAAGDSSLPSPCCCAIEATDGGSTEAFEHGATHVRRGASRVTIDRSLSEQRRGCCCIEGRTKQLPPRLAGADSSPDELGWLDAPAWIPPYERGDVTSVGHEVPAPVRDLQVLLCRWRC